MIDADEEKKYLKYNKKKKLKWEIFAGTINVCLSKTKNSVKVYDTSAI